MDYILFLQYLHFSLFTIFEFTATFFVINLSKDGGSAFNEAHDFTLIVHPVYYRDQ